MMNPALFHTENIRTCWWLRRLWVEYVRRALTKCNMSCDLSKTVFQWDYSDSQESQKIMKRKQPCDRKQQKREQGKKTPVYQWGSSSNEATTDKGYFPHASEDAMGFTFNWLIGTFITSELVFPLWVDRLNPFLWTTTGSSTLHQIKPLQLIPSLHETLCSTYASSRNTRHLYSHFHKLSSGPRWT